MIRFSQIFAFTITQTTFKQYLNICLISNVTHIQILPSSLINDTLFYEFILKPRKDNFLMFLQFSELFAPVSAVNDNIFQSSSKSATVDYFQFSYQSCGSYYGVFACVFDDRYIVTSCLLHSIKLS